MIIRQHAVRNRLLQRMPEEAFKLIAGHFDPVELPSSLSLVRSGQPIEAAVFIESGLACVVVENLDGNSAEIRHVGAEGMVGHSVVLGADQAQTKTFMQSDGHGLKIAADALLPIMEITEARNILLRYVHITELQLSCGAFAAAKCSLQQRLARWLLMCHDRIQGDTLTLTHEFLGTMLGVRRSSITDQLHLLEGMHAVRSTRGIVTICSRPLLIEIAGGCYGLPEKEYERLIGGKHGTESRRVTASPAGFARVQ